MYQKQKVIYQQTHQLNQTRQNTVIDKTNKQTFANRVSSWKKQLDQQCFQVNLQLPMNQITYAIRPDYDYSRCLEASFVSISKTVSNSLNKRY